MQKPQQWPNRLVLVVLLASPALGCVGPSAPTTQVSTDRATYQWPDLLILHVVNLSGEAIDDDHCGGDAQAFGVVAGQWTMQYGRGCMVPPVAPLRSIPAGGSVDDTFPLNGVEGHWRIQLRLQDSRGNLLPVESRTSNEFVVIPRAGTGSPHE